MGFLYVSFVLGLRKNGGGWLPLFYLCYVNETCSFSPDSSLFWIIWVVTKVLEQFKALIASHSTFDNWETLFFFKSDCRLTSVFLRSLCCKQSKADRFMGSLDMSMWAVFKLSYSVFSDSICNRYSSGLVPYVYF